jgi:hypothetical protein
MEFEKAVSLLQWKLDTGGSCESVSQGPLGPAAVLCKRKSLEVFSYLWQEPTGDWTVVTQVSSGYLVKAARLSKKFEKLIVKASRKAEKDKAQIQLSEGKLVASAAMNRPFPLTFELVELEEGLVELIESLLAIASKKLGLAGVLEGE